MEIKYKYLRIPHLPWSTGRTKDDIYLDSIHYFEELPDIVVTEKLDGENTNIYSDYIHARSIDSKRHPSRDWVYKLHCEISFNIPANTRICGENVFAKHSIHYDKLTTYFFVFAIFKNNICLGWDDLEEWCNILNLENIPILYHGKWNEEIIRNFMKNQSTFGNLMEGYVVRNASDFLLEDFSKNIADFVRDVFIDNKAHWLSKWSKDIPFVELRNHIKNENNKY